MNHNSLGCEQPYTCIYMYHMGLDVKSESPSAQDVFLPIPGVNSCAGVTGSGRIANVTLMTALIAETQ